MGAPIPRSASDRNPVLAPTASSSTSSALADSSERFMHSGAARLLGSSIMVRPLAVVGYPAFRLRAQAEIGVSNWAHFRLNLRCSPGCTLAALLLCFFGRKS